MPQRIISTGIALLRRDRTVNWALLDQALVSGVNFLTTILVARFLGVDEFGRFVFAWLIVLFAASIHASIVVWPMMSLGPKQPSDSIPGYFGAIIVQHLIYSGLTLPVLWAALWFISPLVLELQLDDLALPLACVMIAVQTQDALRRYLFTRDRGLAAFVNDAVRYLGQLAALFWLLNSGLKDPSNVLWTIGAAATIAALLGIRSMDGVLIKWKEFFNMVARHWSFGKWLLASAVVAGLAGNIISFTTGAVLGKEAIGAVYSSYTILGVTHILHFGMTNVILVRTAALNHSGGAASMGPYLRRVGWQLFGATAAMSLVAAVAPAFWLGLLLGPDYEAYGYLLLWWAAIVLIESVVLPLESGLRAMEETRPAFMAELWRLVAAIVVLFPLIHWFGMTGVMVSFLVLAIVRTVSLAIPLRRRLRSS